MIASELVKICRSWTGNKKQTARMPALVPIPSFRECHVRERMGLTLCSPQY